MPKTKTIAELRAELAVKEEQLAKLQAKRAGLAEQLDEIDQQIAALVGDRPGRPTRASAKPPSRRWKCPKNVKPLIEYIGEVLVTAKGAMRVKDIVAAVQKAGYKTHSKDFYGIVATAVREGGFKKIERGVYELKAQKKRAKMAARKTTVKKRATSKAKK